MTGGRSAGICDRDSRAIHWSRIVDSNPQPPAGASLSTLWAKHRRPRSRGHRQRALLDLTTRSSAPPSGARASVTAPVAAAERPL